MDATDSVSSPLTRLQNDDRCTPTTRLGGSVFEFHYSGMLSEKRLNDAPLDAFAAAMDQSNLQNAFSHALLDVFVHDARNVVGPKRVEIETVFDGNYHRVSKR